MADRACRGQLACPGPQGGLLGPGEGLVWRPCLGSPTARTVIEATAWLDGLHLLTRSSGGYTAKSPGAPEL